MAKKNKQKTNWVLLVGFVVISQAAGLLGTLFTIDAIPTWYETLSKPIFSPPNWVFGPVWTILYTLIGFAGYIIYKSKDELLIKWFWYQLMLNAIWTPIFFGLKNLELALVVIIFLWGSIFYLIIRSQKKVRPASFALIPYLLWVTFASALNFAIMLLN